jgi:hypothetical protein
MPSASGLHPPFVHPSHNGKTHLALGIAYLFWPPKLGLARGAHPAESIPS